MKRLLNTLYVTNSDAYVRKKDDAIAVYVDDKEAMSVPFHVLDGIVLFGHVGCSAQLMGVCAQRGVSVVILDEAGRFQARVEGPVSGNVLLRREQYRRAQLQDEALVVAKRFVMAKVHNSRIVIAHYGRDYPNAKSCVDDAVSRLQAIKASVGEARTLDELRGAEGAAAHAYYTALGAALRAKDSALIFEERTKRPPKDPVNTALSFFYTMLARDIATACESVGLDPQMGYLHACRPGRASLALDLIEEFRAPYVDRFVMSLFNRNQLTFNDFRGDSIHGVFFQDSAMKKVIGLWQQKKQESVVHPFLKERVKLGLFPFVQAQLFARYLRGDLNDYPACLWR